MNQLCRFILTFFIGLNVFANEEFVQLPLNRGETISDLLYTKLGLSPIYFPGKVLKDVLIFNKLDTTSAKNLKTGFEVKVPKKFLKIQPEPEVNPQIPAIENHLPEISPAQTTKPQTILSHSKFLSVGMGALVYSGKSQAQGNFNGLASFLEGHFVHRAISDQWHLRSNVKIDQTYIKSPNLNITATSYNLLFAAMKRTSEKFDFGPGAGFKRDFFIIINEYRKEKIQYAYLPIFFLTGQYAFTPQLILEGDVGMNLPGNSDEKLKIVARPYASIELSKNFNKDFFANMNSLFESRKIDDSEQMVIKFGFSIGRDF